MNLAQAVAIAPFMQDFYDEYITVVISGLHSIIVEINHKNLNLGVHGNELTNEKSVTFRCLREKKRLVIRVPIEKSQSGISYLTIANPLWNNGELEGAMTVIIFDKRYDALKSKLSIEAVRSGVKGSDFAVAANEVGKLSESTKQSSFVIEVDISEQWQIQ